MPHADPKTRRAYHRNYAPVITRYGLGERFHERAGASTLPAPRRASVGASQYLRLARRGSSAQSNMCVSVGRTATHYQYRHAETR